MTFEYSELLDKTLTWVSEQQAREAYDQNN